MKRDLILCFLLILAVLLFLNRGVRMQGIFFGADEIASDLIYFSYPYREFWATDYLKKGNIPLWNTYLGSGLPILAEAQTGIFYPTSVILYSFLPPPYAFNWLIILSFIFIVLGTYFYAKEIGLGDIPALFASLVFTLSGFMWGHLRHVPIITAVAPMPFIFLAIEKILKSKKGFVWSIILGLSIAFSILAGHYTTTLLIIFILFFYFFFRIKENMRPVILFLMALVLAGLVSAIQLIPSLELAGYSTRMEVKEALERLWGLSFKPKYFLMFLNPYIFGDPSRGTWNMNTGNFWENVGYLGIIPLLLCFVALFTIKNRFALKFCFVLSLILTLGLLTPIYKLFQDFIPGFSITRIPGRFLIFVDFFGAILAGFGLELVAQRINTLKKSLLLAVIILFTLVDLFYFGYPFNTVMPLSYFSEPQSASFLKKDKTLFRILSPDTTASWKKAWNEAVGWRDDLTPYFAQREILPSDYNLLFRIPSPSIVYELSGHFSVRRSGELDNLLINSFSPEAPKNVAAKLLAMANVKYVLTSIEYKDFPQLDLIDKYETNPGKLPVYIYQNKNWLPRVYFVGIAKSFSNTSDLLNEMLSDSFDPAKEVLLETSESFPKTQTRGKVSIIKYSDPEVTIEVNSEDGGFLVLSDTYYPGWKAYVDGKETKIYQANYDYRAIYVEKDKHSVVFNYDPLSFRIGKIISIVSFFGILVIFIFAVINKRRGEERR